MPMYKIPEVKVAGPEAVKRPKKIPKVSITRPLPENLIAFLTQLLNTEKVTYIRIYPDEISYEFVASIEAEEALKWYFDRKERGE